MITRIRIRNFRSFRNTTVNLKPFNVLVGPNDSGKSNFLDAFNVLRRMMLGKLGDVFSGPFRSFNVILFQGSQSKVICFHVEGTARTDPKKKPFKFEYSIEVSPDKEGVLRLDTESLRIMSESSNQWFQCINRSGGATEVKEEKKGGRQTRSYNFDPDTCAVSSLLDVKRHAYIRAVRFELGVTWFYRLQPSEMKWPVEKKEEKGIVVLKENGKNLAEALLYLRDNHPNKFESLKKSLKDTIPSVEDLKFTAVEKWTYVTVTQRCNGRLLNLGLGSISDGLLRFLGILSIVYNPVFLASGFFFEELENGIHPHRLETIISLLQSLALGEHPIQVFVTTHSPYLVDCVTSKDVLIVDKSLGITTIKSIANRRGISKLLDEFSLGEAWFSGALGGTP